MLKKVREHSENPAMWLLVWMAFVYQGSFALIAPYMKKHGFLLYETMDFFVWLPQVWGILGVLFLILGFIGVMTDRPMWIQIGCVAQLMLWTFATTTYVLLGYYALAAGVAATQVLFWGWRMKESINRE